MEYTKFEIDLSDIKTISTQDGRHETLVGRIFAKREIKNPYRTIQAGEKGGYVAVNTLSQEGECWVDECSTIGPGCYVSGDAFVSESFIMENTNVGNSALVKESIVRAPKRASIYGEAKVIDSAIIGDVNISGQAKIEKSTVLGVLNMTYGARLKHCFVEAKDEGITIENNNLYKDEKISGKGAIFNNSSVEIIEIRGSEPEIEK